jgi:hypothetical protein
VTTFEKARMIIDETLRTIYGHDYQEAGREILDALLAARIMPTTMRASTDMFVRFHAHCKHLGKETGYGYRHWYNVSVPESTTRATNGQLLAAYQVIIDGAKEHGILLPEHTEVDA